ncbi:MAG: hypothetical protein ACOYBY_17715 [Dermatophilaceae bacterium]
MSRALEIAARELEQRIALGVRLYDVPAVSVGKGSSGGGRVTAYVRPPGQLTIRTTGQEDYVYALRGVDLDLL